MSLLGKATPGREAFPGDMFYAHSKLLERSSKFSCKYGSGSLTALPIVEVAVGDVAALVPTNIISITDGQIFTDTYAFFQGIRPAIAAGLSVSRVGTSAQTLAMRGLSSSLKLELAKFKETEVFSSFGSDIDDVTQDVLDRGYCLIEILKQREFTYVCTAIQLTILFMALNGYFEFLPTIASVLSFKKLVVTLIFYDRAL